MTDAPLIELRDVTKAFGGVHAVDRVSLRLERGEVLGLLGHNGAGKSTLIKMLSGVFPADSGDFYVRGEKVDIREPRDAKELGIETIYQTLALSENLDSIANLFIGREKTSFFGFMDEVRMERAARETLARMKFNLPNLATLVSSLSGGQRQAIAIARAVLFKAEVLIMDEPTAALGPEETAKVGDLIRELAGQGIGIILISHDIHDVFALADRMLVMRNGKMVGTAPTKDVTEDEALAMIIAGNLPSALQK
ncbi:MAG: ATP-binding cassette domain-containing protein [Alphaproteobacteria bacterium]|nr:ATP-binding cassette domain-containing protein [Alphaproteobacteria bacterium]